MLCGAGALLALTLAVADVGHAQNKAAQKKKDAVKQEDPTPQDYASLSQAKEVVGKLTFVDMGTNTLTLRIEFQQYVPNNTPQNTKNLTAQQQSILRSQQQLMRDYQSILTSRNVFQQQQRMQKWQNDWQQLQMKLVKAGMNTNQYKTVTTAKEFEFDVASDLRVARANLPPEYDDKGNIVTYTKEELKKKQDSVLPGYTAKVDDLTPGQTVKLYLGSRKTTAKKTDGNLKTDPKDLKVDPVDNKLDKKGDDPEATKPAKATPFGGKTTPLDAQAPPRPFVRSVLIQTEADLSTLPKTPEKKKKKQN